MDVMVKYIGWIDERKRPEGFPRQVVAIGTYKPKDAEHLKEIINSEAGSIVQIQGMIVNRDPSSIQDTNKIQYDQRMFVPIHMITHVTTEIRYMPEIPIIKDGVAQLSDGTKVQLQ